MESKTFLKRRPTVEAYQVPRGTTVDIPHPGGNYEASGGDELNPGDWVVTHVNGVELSQRQVLSDADFSRLYEEPRQRAKPNVDAFRDAPATPDMLAKALEGMTDEDRAALVEQAQAAIEQHDANPAADETTPEA